MPTLDTNWMMWNAATASEVVGWPKNTAYQRIAADSAEYKASGFDRILFAPATLGAAGENSGGYDKKEDYVFDGTAFGSEAQCIAAVQAVHAQGMRAQGSTVLHQMDGWPNQEYKSAIFPKDPTCFATAAGQKSYPGNVAPDSVPDPSGGWPDGDLIAYDQADRRMWNGSIAAHLNQMKALGFDDWIIDECKDLHAPFLCSFIDAIRKEYPWAQFGGEYFDGNPFALSGWVNYWMGRRASALDFMFKFNVGTICNNNSKVWMGQLSKIGYNMQDSMRAVTFIEDHDTDTTEGEQTVFNKQLGYDIMLSFPGEPQIYYRDWSTDKNCYGMKDRINNGLWRWKNLAQGTFVTRNAEYQTFVCERLGYGSAPGCICFFNNNQWAEQTVTVQTRYPRNTRLHEHTGNAGYSADKWTDFWGCITVTIPRNVNGCNSLVYGVYL